MTAGVITSGMAPSDAFDPPATIAECQAAGLAFGQARAEVARVSFEQDLTEQLAVLTRVLTFSELDQEQALAAFDQAAWAGWEGVAEDKPSKPTPKWTRLFHRPFGDGEEPPRGS
jgi:hypothetical protein